MQLFAKFIKSVKFLDDILESEYHQHSLWYFVAFIYGIASYFSANINLEISYLIFLIILSSIFAFLVRHRLFLGSFILFLIASFCSGLLISDLRMKSISTVTLGESVSGNIKGLIQEVEPARDGYHIKIGDLTITENDSSRDFHGLVARIKLASTNISGDIDNINAGDIFSGRVKLFPLQGSILPGSYEFGFFQYVRGIGATGFASGKVIIAKPDVNNNRSSFWYKITNSIFVIRNHMHQHKIDILGAERGNFISAILIGITSGIDKNIADSMRGSGISHILSVSGLHLSLIAMIFFFTTRVVLNLSNYAVYNWNIKLIASCVAIIASFGYLILTGSKIAATRAFIMTSIFIIAHMIGKIPYAIRSLFIAAFLILVFYPEYVMHPSFQLSFAAVLCLVSGYELYLKNQHIFGINNGVVANIKFYFLANIYTTIIASLATAPFVIYHFFSVPSYGIAMNLLAVPLMSFVIMPLGSLVLLFYGSGIEEYILPVIGFFVGIIIDSAQYIVQLPGSVLHWGYISKTSLMVFSFGFFWICMWQTKIRYIGVLIILLSIVLMFIAPKPNFIYDTRYHTLINHKKDGSLVFYTKGKLPDFTRDFIINWYGRPQYEVINISKNNEGSSKQWMANNQYVLDDGRSIYTIRNNNMAKLAANKIKDNDIVVYQSNKVKSIDGAEIYVPFAKYRESRAIIGYCSQDNCRFEYSASGIYDFK